MKHYENVRLRKGIGWVDASGDGFVAPPDGEEFEIAARPAGADGFLVYAVDVPRAVAVLMRRPQDLSWSPAEAAFDRLVVILNERAPGAAGRLGELLRQAVEELNIPFQHPERATVGHVTISAGVVAVGDLSRLADDASDAAYAAKSAGRNRVVVKAAGTSGGS